MDLLKLVVFGWPAGQPAVFCLSCWVTGMTWTRKAGIRVRSLDLLLSRQTPYHWATEVVTGGKGFPNPVCPHLQVFPDSLFVSVRTQSHTSIFWLLSPTEPFTKCVTLKSTRKQEQCEVNIIISTYKCSIPVSDGRMDLIHVAGFYEYGVGQGEVREKYAVYWMMLIKLPDDVIWMVFL